MTITTEQLDQLAHKLTEILEIVSAAQAGGQTVGFGILAAVLIVLTCLQIYHTYRRVKFTINNYGAVKTFNKMRFIVAPDKLLWCNRKISSKFQFLSEAEIDAIKSSTDKEKYQYSYITTQNELWNAMEADTIFSDIVVSIGLIIIALLTFIKFLL